jgi:hypothetical protein
MCLAGRLHPSVMTACPTLHLPMLSQFLCSFSAPAAEKIAPHTPPPIFSAVLAALTMASTGILVISFLMILSGIVADSFRNITYSVLYFTYFFLSAD